ncbi:MAG: metallophosphoesterase family protein [Bacteroidota bacterium]
MKVILLTDIHANLPALQAVVKAVERQGYDLLYHAGDAIGIGPFPQEVIEVLSELNSAKFVQGNHDALFVHGIPDPRPTRISDGEARHQQWTHDQLEGQWRAWMSSWPYQIDEEIDGVKLSVLHYGIRGPIGKFKAFIPHPPTVGALDELFTGVSGSIVCYGHNHHHSDVKGARHYVNVGSLGCFTRPEARYAVLEISRGTYKLEYKSVSYDYGVLLKAFERRQVPERAFIYDAFFGGRW